MEHPNKLSVRKVALTGAIYGSAMFGLGTIAGLLGIPGFPEFLQVLVKFYGFYGYSISWTGVIVGAIWGFVEGFVHFGIFAWIYNRVAK